jgi:hypothetical protein
VFYDCLVEVAADAEFAPSIAAVASLKEAHA